MGFVPKAGSKADRRRSRRVSTRTTLAGSRSMNRGDGKGGDDVEVAPHPTHSLSSEEGRVRIAGSWWTMRESLSRGRGSESPLQPSVGEVVSLIVESHKTLRRLEKQTKDAVAWQLLGA